jgi:tetratricopeptide (TPR) repeat protein
VRVALADESIALLDLARGRYRQALAGLESARRAYEALALPQQLAIAEKQLADAYLELRLLPEALALFDTAVVKFGALESPDEQAWALAQRGRTEALLGRTGADASLAQAAALFAAQGNDVGRATVALARGELALSLGQAGAALAWAEQAAAGFGAAHQTDGGARAEVVRAQALLTLGRHAEAGAAFDATLLRARALQQLSVQVRCLTGQGLVAQAARDPATAARAFDAAIELFEDQRRALPDDDMRSAFITEHLRPYQERLRIAIEATTEATTEVAAGTGAGAAALLQLDRFRARALDERLSEGHGADPDDSLQALRERLNWLYRRAQRLQEEGGSSAALSDELLRTEHELLERARRQRLAAPRRVSDNRGGGDNRDTRATRDPSDDPDDLRIDALQAALHDGDALVEYGVLDAELFACVVTRRKVTLVRHMALWPRVLEAAESARFQIETLRHGSAPVQRHLPALVARTQAHMAALHALVWSPLAAELAGCRRVIVVPHAQLGVVPFAALTDGSTSLGERFELALAPSARLALRGLRRPAVPARRVLALGESSRLAHTADEAEFVAGFFGAGSAFVGEQATLQVLQDHAPAADVLHLACHAQFRSDNPRFSALHLHAGALTVEGAEALALKPCTVVLSACETGLNALSAGDEMVGLVRAFMVAGAARVVASLWPVADEITARFMAQFYAALVAGKGAARALQVAQTATRRAHPHPYFWAAFVLYGGW